MGNANRRQCDRRGGRNQDGLPGFKDAHYHPAKRQLEHIVFQAIRQDEKVEAEVPIVLEGDIPAEKAGLMVLHQLDHVEVEALPKDLPDELKVDATRLAELGDKITVADLQIPSYSGGISLSRLPAAYGFGRFEARLRFAAGRRRARGEERRGRGGDAEGQENARGHSSKT